MSKFLGDKSYLDEKLSDYKINGTWAKGPGKQTFRTTDGGILIWYDNGTLQIQGRGNALPSFREMCDELDGQPAPIVKAEKPFEATQNPNLFIVYGHDTVCREQLELILERMDVEHFILNRTAGGGKTIIEALEGHLGKEGQANVGIVLLTPDDFGYSKRDGNEALRPRARQNVILEMGMLLSKLGRTHTIILVKGDIERPSDVDGIIYLQFQDHVKEIGNNLIERLEEAGFNIDQKKARNAIR